MERLTQCNSSAIPTTAAVSNPITSSGETTFVIQQTDGEQMAQEVLEVESISEECAVVENVESNVEE